MTLGPAERFDIIVNFGGLCAQYRDHYEEQCVTDFPGGMAPMWGTQNVMKFIVGRRTGVHRCHRNAVAADASLLHAAQSDRSTAPLL